MMKFNYFFYPNKRILIYGFIVIIMGIFIAGLMLGTLPISVKQLLHYFSEGDFAQFTISLRFQRQLTALCCGGMLALGSAILQGITRNPMVAPDLMGTTSIGCLLIVACNILWMQSPVLNELLGIIGSILGFIICFMHSHHQRIHMILTGIAVSFTANAIMQLMILHSPQKMDEYLHFITGSLYAIEGMTVIIVASMTLLLIPAALLLSKRFIMLSLDKPSCQSLGVPVKSMHLVSYLLAALLIGTSIVGIGHLGFLGIVAPNVARILVGDRPFPVFFLSFLIGGLIYLSADIFGRCIISPAEIPAGIVTNMLSAPLFLYILFRYQRSGYERNKFI